MAEFQKTPGGYTAAAAGLYGNSPQPPSYGLNPPPYFEVSPPYSSVPQRDGKHDATGYQSKYPACPPGPPSMPYPQYPTYPPGPPSMPYPQYPTYPPGPPSMSCPQYTKYPTAAQQPYLPPQYAGYRKATSSIVCTQQVAYAAAPPPIPPYFANQYHLTSAYVVNQKQPATPQVLMQSGTAATVNHITSGYPTTTIIQQHPKSQSLTKEVAALVLNKVVQHAMNPTPRDKGNQVTVIAGGSSVIIRK